MNNIFTNDKGFFQGGKSFGGKGLLGSGGVLSEFANKFKDKPYAGVPGVCPYTGKPLRTPTEQQTGVADEVSGAKPQTIGENAITGNQIMATPEAMQNPLIQQQLLGKQSLINQMGGLQNISGTGAMQGLNVNKMLALGGRL